MDSLTQFVLGAAVTRVVVGPRAGRAAPLLGGVVATLPDLDVFVPLGGAVQDFTFHRSASHSLIVLTVLSPFIAWLVHRVQRPPAVTWRRWLAAVWLTLVTHVALDALTIYGTQLLWPLSERPFGLGSVFIIDPLYTLLLVGGLLGALLWQRRATRANVANATGLALSSAYLVLGVVAQSHVHALTEQALREQGIAHERVLVLAAPFTSLAWRVLVVSGDVYHVTYHSLVAPAPRMRFARYARTPGLLDPVRERWEVTRLRWFTRGYYAAAEVDGEIRLTDLRMGVEPDRYAFSFVVGRRNARGVAPVEVTRIEPRRFRDSDWRRILNVIRGAQAL